MLCANDGSMDLSLAQASVDHATIDRSCSAICGSIDTTVVLSSEYRSMKFNMNNLILILTLTLTDPVTPYFIWALVNKLVKCGRNVAGFVGGALPDLQLFFAIISPHI